MIPRLKPFFNSKEIYAFLSAGRDSVREFEKAFAHTFECTDAVVFPYGRSALWAFFRALGIADKQIVQPAYTCSVVAHATVLSGNIPVFVDNNLQDYTLNIEDLEAAINADTAAVIPTHLYGYPMDVDAVQSIVDSAEKHYGKKIWVIQDCAHSFGAYSQGKSVITAGDCALFGLGISKLISSIFGGMMTFQDQDLADRVRAFRDAQFQTPGWFKSVKRFFYLLATYPAFSSGFYGMVYWLQERTPFLNQLTRAYHLDEKIHFPPDYLDALLVPEAAVGLAQLEKYETIIQRRREIAQFYTENLEVPQDWILPPLVGGATYSHYPIRVPEREQTITALASRGIQAGRVIEYSLPHMKTYQKYVEKEQYPHAFLCSQSMINLPIHPSLRNEQVEKIIHAVNTLK